MKNKFSKIIMACFLLQLPFLVYSNDSLRLNKLDQRVESLETYKNEILDKKFENKSEELTNKIENEVQHAKDDIDDQLWSIKITGWIIALLLAIGVGALLYQYFVGLKKAADKLLKNRLDSHLSENSQYILDMITSQKTENQIKSKKKILLIAGNDDEKNKNQTLLKGMGFSLVETLVATHYSELPVADLFIFSNLNGSMHEDLILEFMEKSNEENNFIFFGGRLNINPQSSYAERVNFANSRYTLYHQIVNTLSFKDILKINS